MARPRVFFDISAGSQPVGRIIMEVRAGGGTVEPGADSSGARAVVDIKRCIACMNLILV